jgi:hypothetical protein
MRVTSFINYRTSFLFVAFLSFASAAAPRALNNPPLINPQRELMHSLTAQSVRPAASAGDFSISANPTSLTVPVQTPDSGSGGMVDGTITLTGLSGFDGNVTLSCAVAGGTGQNQPLCFFPAASPSNEILVNASAPPSTTSIEADTFPGICTVPVFCVVPNIFGGDSAKFQTAALVLLLLTLSSCFCKFLSKNTRARLLCIAFICVAGLTMTGCTNGPAAALTDGCPPGLGFTGGTPPATYTFTVIATSGNLSHSITIPVTVTAQ